MAAQGPPSSTRNGRPFVNFAVIGAERAGTTSLHWMLGQHPDVCVSVPKETHFFDAPQPFAPQERFDWDAYAGSFTTWDGEAAVGESTSSYLLSPDVARRLKQYNPDFRVIAVLRDPAERAFSAFNELLRQEAEALTFAEAIRAEPYRLSLRQGDVRFPPGLFWRYSYVARGRYMHQLATYLEHFDRDHLHLVRFEELANDPVTVCRRLFGFLGVDDTFRPQSEHMSKGSYSTALDDADRRLVRSLHREDTLALAEFTGWDLSAWLS